MKPHNRPAFRETPPRKEKKEENPPSPLVEQTPFRMLFATPNAKCYQEDNADELLPGVDSPVKMKSSRPPFKPVEIGPAIPYQRAKERTAEQKFTKNRTTQHVAYSLPNLPDLLKLLPASHGIKSHGIKSKKLRYAMNLDNQIFFAFEGVANTIIPPHYKLVSDDKETALCRSAGNLYLKRREEGSYYVSKINHKSGDFAPPFDSMKWSLATLLAHEERLPPQFMPETLEIEMLDQNGGFLASWYVTKKTLQTELATHIKAVKSIAPSPMNKSDCEKNKMSAPPSAQGINRTLLSFLEASPSLTPPSKRVLFNPEANAAVEELFLGGKLTLDSDTEDGFEARSLSFDL